MPGLDAYLLVFGRVSGLFLSAPVFSSRQLPVMVRVLLTAALAVMLARMVHIPQGTELANSGLFIMALAGEVLIGYAIGFVAYFIFAAVQLAGQLVDMQMGFGIVNVINPESGATSPLVGSLFYLVALLVYLGLNGHHQLLMAVYDSYRFIPVLGVDLAGGFARLLVDLGAFMFVAAVKIAAPVVAAVFVADVALGFMARSVPQMNVFLVGIPLKILAGLVMLLLTMPVFVWVLQVYFDRFFSYLDQALMALAR